MSQSDPNFPPMPPSRPGWYPPQTPPAAAAPVRALSMPYQQRPGILTAVGVISIIVACLGCITGLIGGCASGEFYMMAKMSRAASSGSSTSSFGIAPATPPATPATNPAANSGTTAQPAPPGALTATEISGAVQRAQSATGNKLNSAQLSALTTALQDPNQTLITPGTAWSPVRMASVNPDGSAFVYLSGGYVGLSPQGQVTLNSSTNPLPKFNVSGVTCALCAAESLLSVGLAVLLLIAAILVMRNSPTGRRLHLIYAILKIPLAIAGAFALGSLLSQFYGSIGAAMPGAGGTTLQAVGAAAGAIISGLGLIYPIALLIALNTPGVRAFYASVR
ncbi:MAG TPA: hypothetical protein VFE47_11035 [Tepidisphaeraceae bacterium]|jgi:hypothetical protein|nr:hypothetical protein [Tepidisphaeraceae bacterium]